MQERAAPSAAMPENWQTALAIVAHPDDLEYGAASAIAKWTAQGKTVTYVMVSKGEAGIDGMDPSEVGPLRMQEEINSARVVGVDTVEFLDYTDGVIEYGLPLRRDLSRAIRRHRPDVIITINHHLQFFSGHLNMADHRWVGLAVFDAARDAGNRWIFPELLAEGYEPWNDVRFVAVFGSTEPTHAVDVSEHWETGLASLREHKAYLENLGDVGNSPFEFLTAHAREADAAFGCDYASYAELVLINEAF
ncbi:MAG: PIG-L family deacetylase [Chloroflexi bacterium]|nr:PIG-L family deacetylase [Chloroflexota bacterium]MYD49369.1 PIG-L family deacetylase [Chloroflexota bacterium]